MSNTLDKYEQDIEDSFNAQKSIKTNSLLDNLKIAATKHLKSKKSITIGFYSSYLFNLKNTHW